MHVLESEQDFAHIELGQLLGEAPLLQQVKEELAACADVHDKEEFSLTLKRPMKLDHEWVVNLFEDATLAQNWLNLVLVNQTVLAEDFNGIKPASVLLSRQDNSAEATAADNPHLLEVIDADVAPLCQP